MSTPLDTPTAAESPGTTGGPDRDLAQLGLAGLLVVVGAYTFYDSTTLRVGFGDPVGPRVFPYVIGAATVVLGLLLVLATLRGDVPEGEGGEDVDLRQPADWVTVAKLVGVLLFTVLTVSFRANQVVCGLALTIFGGGLSSFLGASLVGKQAPARVSP